MSVGTRLFTMFYGELVGRDEFGNRYYVDRRTKGQKRERRWVMYNGSVEASRVPAEWHAWLHRTIVAAPATASARKTWQQPHQPNHTGTVQAYLPEGHVLKGGQRAKATGDYEPWMPN